MRPQEPQPLPDDLLYYTQMEPVRLRLYGRMIQKMVDHLRTIEDDELRKQLANETVRVMATVAPQAKDQTDYKKKLWDHLFYLADYDLDIETPHPITPRNLEGMQPRMVEYHPHDTRYKQYGQNIVRMIRKATEMEEGEKKNAYIQLIANMMKQFLQQRNPNQPADQVVCQHLSELSGGSINLNPNEVEIELMAPTAPPSQQQQKSGKSRRKKRKSRGRRNKNRRSNKNRSNPNN